MISQPPKWADLFLQWYCKPEILEDLQGDLYELYDEKCLNGKKRVANLLFIWLVIRSLRISTINSNILPKNSFIIMTKNNLKIAFRVLKRDSFNTGINLLGLTIGIACFILMGLYFIQETSYDQFHTKKDRIYRSWLKEDYGDGKIFFNSQTPLRFEELFEENFPEVETAVQFSPQRFLIGQGENRINEQVVVISPEFFEVFDFQITEGNITNPLSSRNDIVISESYAKKYFGDTDPIGKTITAQTDENTRDFIVAAIFENIRKTSSIQFNMAVSNENNKDFFGERALTAWFNIIPETYILLKENTTPASVNEKMQDVVMAYLKDEVERGQYNIGLQPITDIHLNPSIPLGYAPVANPQYVYILGGIGLLVLFIACINYTTLSIAQSLKRAKEVGMRKVLGAIRPTLVYQYLSEGIVITFVAMIIGVAVAILLIPIFNHLTGADVSYFFEPWHLGVFIITGITIGISAGIYPAIVLSNFRIISALRGKLSSSGNHVIRKGMVVFQFLITIFLISSTLIMSDQLNFLENKDLGYNYDAAISVNLNPSADAQRISQIISSGMANGEILKQKLKAYPEISKITMATHNFGTRGWSLLAFTDKNGLFRKFRMLTVDPNYLKSFDIKILEGRDFESENSLDKTQSIIINKAAADYFGFEEPIGKKLPGDDFGEHRIIGVTDNFHFASLHEKVEPLIITQNVIPMFQGISDIDLNSSLAPKLIFTYKGDQLLNIEEILKKEWQSTFPNERLTFSFIDERIKLQYQEEARMSKLITISTLLSIVIASLGLLGLTVLVANSRIKEIGIRKVMGATPFTIFKLLANSFSSQLLIAIALSIPLTYWLMTEWLQNFEYRINIGFELFLTSGIISVVLAVLVVSFHSIKAAMVNPVNSLRTE